MQNGLKPKELNFIFYFIFGLHVLKSRKAQHVFCMYLRRKHIANYGCYRLSDDKAFLSPLYSLSWP